MSRTGINRLPEFNGVAPRVSAADLNKYKGQFVTLVCKPIELDDQGLLKMVDVVAGEELRMFEYPDGSEAAEIDEFVCYVNPANGQLQYHSHGTLNDDFDCDKYKELVKLIPKYPGIF